MSQSQNILDKQKPVELKDVKKLTSEEREQIISNFKNGIDNEFYDVKTLKNGTTINGTYFRVEYANE